MTLAQARTQLAALIATLAREPSRDNRTGADRENDFCDGPGEDWLSDRDADRIADREENRRWRSLP
jgi:hypothetical protein